MQTKGPTKLAKLKHWLQSKKAKYRLYRSFPEMEMKAIKQANRKSLGMVETWMDNKTLELSNYRYGIMPGMEERINQPIDDHTTYTDILCNLSKKMNHPIQYLELGVSTGKNFWQLANFFETGSMVGFDIEEIAPALSNRFTLDNRIEFGTSSPAKKECPSFSKCSYNNIAIAYLSADEFDEMAWLQLSNFKFNMFFSDAFHSPQAILHECEQLLNAGLLDSEEIVMMWDDLGGDMTAAFENIFQQLRTLYPRLYKQQFITNGWMNYKSHQIGIITTIPI